MVVDAELPVPGSDLFLIEWFDWPAGRCLFPPGTFMAGIEHEPAEEGLACQCAGLASAGVLSDAVIVRDDEQSSWCGIAVDEVGDFIIGLAAGPGVDDAQAAAGGISG